MISIFLLGDNLRPDNVCTVSITTDACCVAIFGPLNLSTCRVVVKNRKVSYEVIVNYPLNFTILLPHDVQDNLTICGNVY